MKIKCQPEDFVVEELTDLKSAGGAFALYRLHKQSIGTPEAVEAICRRWNIARQRISYGGLKDRHAETSQHLTIHRGPKRGLRQTHFSVDYLGQTSRPFGPTDISANRFEIVLRDIAEQKLGTIVEKLDSAAKVGLPNYFDEQRFGSVGESGQFVAQPWCLGDYEKALWLALAEENRHDRPDEQEQKRILRELWGKWQEAKDQLARSHRRSVVTYLVDHPHDFRRALALIRVDLRRLYLSAFQSHLWNQLLADWLRAKLPESERVEVELGPANVIFWKRLPAELEPELVALQLPLPAARQQEMPADLRVLVDRVVNANGLQLRELRVKYPRDSFFSKGNRRAVVQPVNLQHFAGDDGLYPNKKCVTVRMDLPRGSYATILVKQLGIVAAG